MFDYKKYSVHEYNTILKGWYEGIEPADTNIFKKKYKSIKRNVDNLMIIFTDNHWIKIDKNGWWSMTFCDNTQDVISDRHFYSQSRTSESLGLGHIAYTRRPAKGITYKNIVLNSANISRKDNCVHVNVYRKYLFNVEYFKKYKEYQLSTDCGLVYYEKSNYKGEVLRSSVRVVGTDKSLYNVSLERSNDRKKVIMEVHKNFKKEKRLIMPFVDCDIENIFNKYIMFDFELTSDQSHFEIVEMVRTQLRKHVENTYKAVKEEGKNADLIGRVLKRIEEIENDEYQVQKRP